MTIKLGDSVRDRISRFEGVVIATAHYIGGERMALVQPTIDVTSKALPAAEWFLIKRLEYVGS